MVLTVERAYSHTIEMTGGGFATFDGAVSNVTLSNGNLTATHSNSNSNSGARSASLKNSGKYYYEVTVSSTLLGQFDCVGVLASGGTFTNFVNDGTACGACYSGTGSLWGNDSYSGQTISSWATGRIDVAVDLDNEKIWFRRNSGSWNGGGGADPATNTNGVSLASANFAPAVGFGGSGTGSGEAFTANFGASAFSGTIPSGFTSGWPI